MLVFSALTGFFPVEICTMFSVTDPDTVSIARDVIPMFSVSLVLCMVNTLIIAFHQSNNHIGIANTLTVSRSFAAVVLSAVIFVKMDKAEFIWLSFLIAEAVTLVLAVILGLAFSAKKEYNLHILLIDKNAQLNGKYLAFTVRPTNSAATESAEKISDFCEQNELSPKITMSISLAIEEILVSINEHCFDKAAQQEEKLGSSVRILLYDDIIILRFRAAGKIYDPVAAAMEDDDPLSDTMGIKMLQKLAMNISYNRVFGINNLTIIIYVYPFTSSL